MDINLFLNNLYQQPTFIALNNIPARIDYLSHLLLNKPYIVNPQGEGIHAEFDTAPLYRFDGFDCVTFVNNILALALSQNASDFEKKLLQINYYHAIPTYENRFHFMSIDWNSENQKNKIIRDITREICDKKNTIIAEIAEGEIDKPAWFLKKIENETVARATLLKKYAAQFQKQIGRVPYLPFIKLFDDNKNPNPFIFNQIPHASIIEIVRPNWNVTEKIGTNLHVSHVGFAIRKSSSELFFRHASSEAKKVVEILLSDYLVNYIESETAKGINVQIVGV